MSVEITFKVGGREVTPDEIGDAIKALVYEQIRNNVAEKLREVKCPEHGQFARVTIEADDAEHLRWKISGCCEKLRNEAVKALHD